MKSRSTLFVMLVQTYVLGRRPPLTALMAVHAVHEAWHLTEDALPEDSQLAKAAEDFALFVLREREKPTWLAEYEAELRAEANITRVMIRLSEHDAAGWWYEAERLAPDAPEVVQEIIRAMVSGREKSMIVAQAQALAFVGWMKSLPGFDSDEWPFSFAVQPKPQS